MPSIQDTSNATEDQRAQPRRRRREKAVPISERNIKRRNSSPSQSHFTSDSDDTEGNLEPPVRLKSGSKQARKERRSSKRSAQYSSNGRPVLYPSVSNVEANIGDGPLHYVWPIVIYLRDIFGQTMNMLKTPISLLLTLLIVIVASNLFLVGVKSAACSVPGFGWLCSSSGVSWVCAFPGSGKLLAECSPPDNPTSMREVHQLIQAHDELDKVQEIIAGQISLPLFMKRSESAIREVSKRVELSDLPSKAALVPLFNDYWKKARDVGFDVERFFSHVGRTHDMAIGITAMTEERLQDIQAIEGLQSRRQRSFVSNALSIFQSSPPSPFALVREEYLVHLDRLKGTVDKLIAENKIVLSSLQDLEDILFVIGEHAYEDSRTLKDSKRAEQLGLLAIFRPDTPQLQKVKESIATLNEVKAARKFGETVFSGSLLLLRKMSTELDDLRVRIVEQEVVVETKDIATLEYNIGMIGKSLDKMRTNKEKTDNAKAKYLKDLHEQIDDGFGD